MAESKPGLHEWMRMAALVQKRLERVALLYDQDKAEREARHTRQQVDKLKHILASEKHRPPAHDFAAAERQLQQSNVDELQIQQLYELFEVLLHELPTVSRDMQRILGCPWGIEPRGYVAAELFHGDRGAKNGIGSGMVEDGYLPAMIDALLRRERKGTGDRTPTTQSLTADA
ncbi:MAG: hypothetical protein EB121_03295, partial [Alphaproteobacteria bacterium]|nr:hypothetical protein [Alphaproteobacteria bacterium]